MMNFKNKILLSIIGGLSMITYAQQQPQFTNYMYNTMSVNPAYAGVRGRGSLNFFARTQWLGFEGGGNTQTVSYNSPFFRVDGLSWGVNVVNDKIGPISEVFSDVNISYGITLGEGSRLAFGLKPGVHYFNLNSSQLDPENPGDAKIASGTSYYPSMGVGLYLHGDNYYLGVSTPNFLVSKKSNDENKFLGREKPHIYFISGYIVDLNDDLKFKPAALLKAVEGAPVSIDFSLNFLLKEKLNLGFAWRFGDSMSALLGLQITENLHIGYSYDLTTSSFRKTNKGTHELFVRYDLTEVRVARRLKCFYY